MQGRFVAAYVGRCRPPTARWLVGNVIARQEVRHVGRCHPPHRPRVGWKCYGPTRSRTRQNQKRHLASLVEMSMVPQPNSASTYVGGALSMLLRPTVPEKLPCALKLGEACGAGVIDETEVIIVPIAQLPVCMPPLYTLSATPESRLAKAGPRGAVSPNM